MNIDLTETQVQLRDTAARFLAKECSFDVVRSIENESDLGYSQRMWQQFAEMGWLGILVPEDRNGMGLGMVDCVILMRELGRRICPSPFLHSAVTAVDLISRCGTQGQKETLLPEIAAGRCVFSFAFQELSRSFHPSHIRCTAALADGGYVLRGTKMFVEFAQQSDVLLVVARTGGSPAGDKDCSGLTLFLVDRDAPGLEFKRLPTMSRDRQYEVVFDDVRIPASSVLGVVHDAWTMLEPALHRAAVAFCGYTNGAGFEMHEHATEYAKNRVQFGRPIGQMMTIQMYLAQAITELYGADALTLFTASNMDQGRDVRGYVAKAKSFCAETVSRVMDTGSQVFGGMGYMEEQDTTLFLRRGKQFELSLGGTEYWEEVIAEEIIDKEPTYLM